MDNETLPAQTKQQQIDFIDKKFELGKTVNQLHFLMSEVTKETLNYQTVNAACNCVQQLNNTIDMAIKAARFLSEK